LCLRSGGSRLTATQPAGGTKAGGAPARSAAEAPDGTARAAAASAAAAARQRLNMVAVLQRRRDRFRRPFKPVLVNSGFRHPPSASCGGASAREVGLRQRHAVVAKDVVGGGRVE